MGKKGTMVAGVVLIVLTGCPTTKEQTGKLLGGGLGGAAGYGISRTLGAKTSGQVLGTIAGTALGAWLGSEIGRQLDERDRQTAQMATAQVLNRPTPEPAKSPPRKSVSTAAKPAPQAPEKTPAIDQSTPPPSDAATVLKPTSAAPTQTWKSDHNPDVSGSSQVVAASTDTQGRECKKVREIAYIRGKEVQQETVYCRGGASGPWTVQA